MEIALYRTSHAAPELQRGDRRKVDSYIFCHYQDAIDTYAGTQDIFGRVACQWCSELTVKQIKKLTVWGTASASEIDLHMVEVFFFLA